MKFTAIFAVGLSVSSCLALPIDATVPGSVVAFNNMGKAAGEGAAAGAEGSGKAAEGGMGAGKGAGEGAGKGAGEGAGQGAGQGAGEGAGQGEGQGAGEGAKEGAKEGEGEGENENEQEAQFDTGVALPGGDVKQDTNFPAVGAGVVEIEFQNANGNTLTVKENKAPVGAAPAGFEFLETSSFTVSLADDATGATLQKMDFKLNAANAAFVADGEIGKFDAATNAFVIGASVGELEREVEETELALKVADLNGEWAIFKPAAAGGGDAGAGAGAGAGAEAGAGAGAEAGAGAGAGAGQATTGSALLDSVLTLIGQGAASAGVAIPPAALPAAPAAPAAPETPAAAQPVAEMLAM